MPASNCQGLRPTLASMKARANLIAAGCFCLQHSMQLLPILQSRKLLSPAPPQPDRPHARPPQEAPPHDPKPARPAALCLSRSPSSRQVSRSILRHTKTPTRELTAVVAVGSLQHAPPKSSQFLCVLLHAELGPQQLPAAPSSPRFPATITRASVPAHPTPTAILTHKGEGAGRNKRHTRAGDLRMPLALSHLSPSCSWGLQPAQSYSS